MPYACYNGDTTLAVQGQKDDTLRKPYAGCNEDTTSAVQGQPDTTFNRNSGAHLAVFRGNFSWLVILTTSKKNNS